jgi:hypothetical protein
LSVNIPVDNMQLRSLEHNSRGMLRFARDKFPEFMAEQMNRKQDSKRVSGDIFVRLFGWMAGWMDDQRVEFQISQNRFDC